MLSKACVYNRAARDIHSCSMSSIQCDNKEEPLFLLLDVSHHLCFSLVRQKASIR